MKGQKGMNRRGFLKTSAVSVAGVGLLAQSKPGLSEEKKSFPARIKEYRTLGRTGFKVSDIGAGKPYNVAVLKVLLETGVNYIDTGEAYGRGQSEKTVGQAIQGRDRKSLFINSKLHMRGNPSQEEILSRFQKCLERLQTDYLDCMMIHSCPDVKMVMYSPFHEAMEQMKAEGKLRFVGLSNHGGNYNDVPVSMEKVHLAAIKDGRFDVLLVVYNFLKRKMGEKILKAAQEKNIGITIMKVNPVGSYHAYKARLEDDEKEGKPTKRLQLSVARFKKRVDECQPFLKKHRLTDNEAIRSAAYGFVLNTPKTHSALFKFSTFKEIDSVVGVSGTRFSSE